MSNNDLKALVWHSGVFSSTDLVNPVGLNKKQLNDYYLKLLNEVPHIKKEIKRQYTRSKRYSMCRRIETVAFHMIAPVFVTITLNDNYVSKDCKSIIRTFKNEFKSDFMGCYYCLITDYGGVGSRLHFHGFVDVVDVDYFKTVCSYKGHKNKNGGYTIWNYDSKVGFVAFQLPDNYECLEKEILKYQIRYMTKYATKDLTDSVAFMHKCYTNVKKF